MMATPEVGTVSFFRLYDDLADDAERLEDATVSFQSAKTKRESVRRQISRQQTDLRWTKSFIKEQKDRIQLVSDHWFYGKTVFQPQLWLRGGCAGKIERARLKLTRAQDQDLPFLMETIRRFQNTDLPESEAEVQTQLHRFDLSANAASEREVMRHRTFQAFPSPQLLELADQQSTIEQRKQRYLHEVENLGDIILKLFDGDKMYRCSKKLLDEALQHNRNLQALKSIPERIHGPMDSLNSQDGESRSETRVADGTTIVAIEGRSGQKDLFHLDQNGKILTTNFPCPSGCGFLVTWHESHCCGACKRGGDGHGRRCGRKVVSSQQGGVEKLAILQEAQQRRTRTKNAEEDACNRLFSEARKEAKGAERIVLQALSGIELSIGERYTVTCSDFIGATDAFTARSPPGGHSCPKVRVAELEQESAAMIFRKSRLSQQIVIVQKLQGTIRLDMQDLQTQSDFLHSRTEEEEDRIFSRLRGQVFIHESPNPPSASSQTFNVNVLHPPAFAPRIPATVPTAPEETTMMAS